MKTLIMSDLHLEFSNYVPKKLEVDLVVLAGDIHKGHSGIIWAREIWPNKQIVYVAGNHEFYGRDREKTLENLRKTASILDVNFLDNDEAIIGDMRILGTTLWTDFCIFGNEDQFKYMERARYKINDFNVIRNNNKTFTPEDALSLHKISIDWLEMKLSDETYAGKTVVVTHHAPSKKSVPKQYTYDKLTPCFSSSLERIVEQADYWIHGHMHESFDYQIKKCRVVCNPRGYNFGQPENILFDENKVIEI